jgi:DNA-binding NtrC family response regulator
MRRGATPEVHLAEWRRIASEARIYASVGAWDAAHEILWSALEPIWLSPDVPSEAIESVGLLLIACIHLDHSAHMQEGTAWLREVLSRATPLEPEARVLALLLAAREDVEAADFAAARRLLDEVENAGIASVSAWVLAHADIVRAKMEARQGSLGAAERVALRATSLAEKSGSDVLLGDSLSYLASVLRFQRKIDAAQRLYAKAATCYWRAGDAVGRVSSLVNRAALLNGLGLLHESGQVFEEAHGAAISVRKESSALRARLGIGWVAARGGNLKKARHVLLSAWRQARRLDTPRDEALALEYLAETYLLAGALAKTRIAAHRCKRLAHRQAPEGDIAIEIAIREALLLVAEGEIKPAITHARKATKRARQAELPWEEAQAYRVLGTALVRAGRNREALGAFQSARELLERIGEQLERRVVDAWIDELNRRRRTESARPSEEPESAASMPAAKEVEVEGVRFWLDHPLLGPGYLRARGRNRRRRPSVHSRHSAAAGVANVIGHPAAASDEHLPKIHGLWAELGLVTRTPALMKTLRLAETFAPGPFPLLLLGETGTGKELFAQGLHALSRQAGRFVPVNCAAAHREIFLAELFGARKGAYTGAYEERSGLIQEAKNGTIFFDEIADLDPEAQGFLLRFLDSGEIRPLGSPRSSNVKTRVVTATCRDLQAKVLAETFRRDLYARLVASVLRLPPLRERLDDIEPLSRVIWDRLRGDPDLFDAAFTPEVLVSLRDRPWPGNVRDLVHVVGQAILFVASLGPAAAAEHIIENAGKHWHPEVARSHGKSERRTAPQSHSIRPRRMRSGDRSVEELEWALETAEGHIPDAAKLLGISRSHAYRLYKALRTK